MKLCKACGNPFASSDKTDTICFVCQDAIKRLNGYVVPVRHGRWIMGVDLAEYEYGTCSVCGYIEYDKFPSGDTPNYCCNCGAKMDGKGDSNG